MFRVRVQSLHTLQQQKQFSFYFTELLFYMISIHYSTKQYEKRLYTKNLVGRF